MNTYEQTLREMRHGRSLAELSEELARLVQAVRETGRAGSLTYKLTIKPASAGDVVTVQLEDDLKCVTPKPARGSSIFFATEENTLQRTDPRQREFQLRAVSPALPTVETKTA
jgi:hypothetical protein